MTAGMCGCPQRAGAAGNPTRALVMCFIVCMLIATPRFFAPTCPAESPPASVEPVTVNTKVQELMMGVTIALVSECFDAIHLRAASARCT